VHAGADVGPEDQRKAAGARRGTVSLVGNQLRADGAPRWSQRVNARRFPKIVAQPRPGALRAPLKP